MQHNQLGRSGSQLLSVSLLKEGRLNLMSFLKEKIWYRVGCPQYSLLVGCLLQMPEAEQTTFMAYNGYTISMLRHILAYNLLMNIVFFFATAMTAISQLTLLGTAFKITSSLFFFHLILLTSCNH